jgi:glycosyltransferase involved in cell wall biosynthesis
VHNQRGHDGAHPRLERILWACLGRLSTHLHTFSRAGAAAFTDSVPTARRLPLVVIPHGDYGPVVGRPPTRADARATFGLDADARVCLTFGKLSAYKGLDKVVTAFLRENDPAARLLICGRPTDEDTVRYLAESAAQDDRILVVPRFLEQQELTAALVACDVVVLPYERVTNSGSALMSLTLARPVVLPRTPVFGELAAQVGPGWVHLLDGAPAPEDLVPDASVRGAGARPHLDWCSWDTVTRSLADLLSPSGRGVGRG